MSRCTTECAWAYDSASATSRSTRTTKGIAAVAVARELVGFLWSVTRTLDAMPHATASST
jgi:hypothetical protein